MLYKANWNRYTKKPASIEEYGERVDKLLRQVNEAAQATESDSRNQTQQTKNYIHIQSSSEIIEYLPIK